MSFNKNKPRQDYEANAGQTAFPFIFAIFLDTDIKVYHTPISTGVTVELTLNTNYTVTISGTDGGVVTITNPTLVEGDFIVLERSLDLDRLIEYQTSGDLLASTLNLDQDYQSYMVADLDQKFDNVISVPPGTPGFNGQLPAPVAEAYLRWSDDARTLENDIEPPTWRVETEVLRDETEVLRDETEVLRDETEAISSTSAAAAQLEVWKAEAEKMTADSYATEAEDVFVNSWASDGDGTFTATPTTEYSALHYSAKAASGLGLNPEVTTLQIGGEYISPYNMRNKLINGGFDIWQRGTIVGDGSTDLGYKFLADRWGCNDGSGGFFILSRQIASLTEEFKYFHRVDFPTRSATANASMGQKIEGVGTLANKNITLSFKTKGTMSGTFTAYARQNFGTGGTPSTQVETLLGTFTIGATFTEKEFTIALPSIVGKTLGSDGNDYLEVYISMPPNRLGQFDIAQVQLEEGSVATPFEQRPIGMELALCQRYYEIIFKATNIYSATFYTNHTNTTVGRTTPILFPVQMRSVPSISISGSYKLLTGGNLTALAVDTGANTIYGTSFIISGAGFTAGTTSLVTANNDINATITADAEL